MKVLGAAPSCLLLLAAAMATLAAGASLAQPSRSAHQLRISGGQGTNKVLRFQVALIDTYVVWCSGALLSETWVITAGTCVDGKTGKMEVRAGMMVVSDTNAQKVVTTAADRMIHPHFEPEFLDNDIALIKLPTPLTLGPKVAAIALPTYGSAAANLVGKEIRISGWGKTSNSGKPSDNLQVAIVKVAANSVCEKQYGNKVIGTKLCLDTSGENGTPGPSPCTGDAGGPVTYYDNLMDETVLHGIVSFGFEGDCTSGKPVVFTRVSSFLDHIESVTGIPIQD